MVKLARKSWGHNWQRSEERNTFATMQECEQYILRDVERLKDIGIVFHDKLGIRCKNGGMDYVKYTVEVV